MQSELRLWKHLPAELVFKIFSFFPPNELACTIRLVNKASAEFFKDSLVVHLSQLSPEDAFALKWSNRQAMQNLTLWQRQHLLHLTARSGSVKNLQVALAATSFRLCEGILNSAASAGHLHACQWLTAKDCPISCRAVTAAAEAGHVDVVRWLLRRLTAGDSPGSIDAHVEQAWVAAVKAGRQNVCEGLQADGFAPGREALFAAAHAGRVDLTDRLLQEPQLQRALTDNSVCATFLRRAAYGYDLPALQRLFSSLRLSGLFQEPDGRLRASVADGGVSSPTADWRAKTEWLEEQNFPLSRDCEWYDVAKAPDAVERLIFIRERVAIFPPEPLIWGVVDAENVSLLQFLQHDGFFEKWSDWNMDTGMEAAAELGNVALMEALVACGCPIIGEAFRSSVTSGHLHALEWLWAAEIGPGPVAENWGSMLVCQAAWTGKVEMVEWLVARGCPLSETAFCKAARVGSPPLLEWLAARGCPMGDEGAPYVIAGRNGDMITLECLRRLHCPWGFPSIAFYFAVSGHRMPDSDGTAAGACSLEVLRWLHAQGCPVDWELADAAAQDRTDSEAEQVREWVRSQRLIDDANG